MERAGPPKSLPPLRPAGKEPVWVDRPAPAELGLNRVKHLPGQLQGNKYGGLPAMISQMEGVQGKVEGMLATQKGINEAGILDAAQLDAWRQAVSQLPVSSLHGPAAFNRPSPWEPRRLSNSSHGRDPPVPAKAAPQPDSATLTPPSVGGTVNLSAKEPERAPVPPQTPPSSRTDQAAPLKGAGAPLPAPAVPRPDLSAVKVAWGATEGGRDKLQWVRQLIRFTETHPLLIVPPAGVATGGGGQGDTVTAEAELVGGAPGERGIKQQVFPAAHPSRREDVRLLGHWLTETLKHLQDNLPKEGLASCEDALQASDGEALANGALWVYSAAFDEFRRALATESRDRAELLAAMWDHCFALVQARAALSYEGVLEEVRHEMAARGEAAQAAAAAADGREVALHGEKADLRKQVDLKEAQLKSVAQRMIKAERAAALSAKEKALLEEALQREITARLAAEEQALRAQRRADAEEAAAAAAATKLAALALKKDSMVHTSVQEAPPCQDVQVDVDLVEQELQAAAAVEAELRSAMAALQRDYDTASVLTISLQEQLKDRDQRIYMLEARAVAAEERADASEKTGFDMQREIEDLRAALEDVSAELSQTAASLTASRREGAKAREDAAAAAAAAAERLAVAQAATAAAQAEAAAAQAYGGEAVAKAAESIQQVKRLQERLDVADRDLHAVQELTRAVHKQLMETECTAAFTVEDAADAEGEESPTHQILDLAHTHIEGLYLQYVETASKLNSVTAQLADCQVQRAAAEAASQEAKLERSRAVRAAEEASLATAAAVDDADALRAELADERRVAEAREALVAGLEADLKGRDTEVARLQAFVHKSELLQMERDGLKLKVEMLEERLAHATEKADATGSRAQELEAAHEEVADKVAGLEELSAQQAALIEELREGVRQKDMLAQALEDLRGQYAALQRQFKQASLDLLQARLVVKNIGDASSADSALVAAADAVDAAATPAAATAAATGDVTPPRRPVSEATPSAVGGDAQSSASSYLPAGLAHMLGGSGTRSGAAALPATMQLSAQLANAQVKIKLERQRADAAEAQVRQLQLELAVTSRGPAAAVNTPIIQDKLTGVLQEQLSMMEGRAEAALADLAMQQARADALDRHLTQARAALTAAPAAAGAAADAATAAAAAAAETAAAEAAAAAAAAEQMHARNSELQKEVHSLHARVRRLTSEREAGGGIRNEGAALVQSASRLAPQASIQRDGSALNAFPGSISAVRHGGTDAVAQPSAPGSPAIAPSGEAGGAVGSQAAARGNNGDAGAAAPRAEAGAYDTAQSGGSDMDSMMADINREVQQRTSASLRLKVGLLSYFCNNMRRRCRHEVLQRVQAEQRGAQREAELLQEAAARERALLDTLEDIMHAVPAALAALREEFVELHTCVQESEEVEAALRVEGAAVAAVAQKATARFTSRVDEGTQSALASVDGWIDFVRGLPADAAPEGLMSHSAVRTTIVRILDMRTADLAAAHDPEVAVASDSVFDSIAAYYRRQYAGDGDEVQVPELMHVDGPVARLIMSCRQYLKDPKVRLFAMFTGIVPEDFLGHEPWQFLVKALFCTRLLMDVNWRLLVRAWPTDRGAPLPVPAVMDLLANLYNAENPTQLPVTKAQVAGLLKQTKIGPAVDFDVLLLALVHEFMLGECPQQPWAAPRRITDGRLPSLTNLGGAALTRTGLSATGHHASAAAMGTMRSVSRQKSRAGSRAPSAAGGLDEAAATQRRERGAMDVYAIVSELQEVARNAMPDA
eukprot:jgi/Ulvmu1/6042/UM027_0019.1